MIKEPFRGDGKKFVWTAGILTGLVILSLVANIIQETVLIEAGSYVKRRIYYEQVISQKGLGLHEGKYWKEEK